MLHEEMLDCERLAGGKLGKLVAGIEALGAVRA
jgi:hypothetical protein